MKKSLGPLMSSANSEWETPPELFRLLHTRFDFGIDVAATQQNALLDHYLDVTDNALDPGMAWAVGPWWCNPPYGRGLHKWVAKALEQQALGAYGVMLLPSRTDTKWFHAFWGKPGVQVTFLKGRLKFRLHGKPTDPAPFPSLLVYFGPAL